MNHNPILLGRGQGKTTALLEHCSKTRAILVVDNESGRDRLRIDIRNNKNISSEVVIITYREFIEGTPKTLGKVTPLRFVIDDLDRFAEYVCDKQRGYLDTYSLTL